MDIIFAPIFFPPGKLHSITLFPIIFLKPTIFQFLSKRRTAEKHDLLYEYKLRFLIPDFFTETRINKCIATLIVNSYWFRWLFDRKKKESLEAALDSKLLLEKNERFIYPTNPTTSKTPSRYINPWTMKLQEYIQMRRGNETNSTLSSSSRQ